MSGNYVGDRAFRNAVIFLQSAIAFADRQDMNNPEHRITWCNCRENPLKMRLIITKKKFIEDVKQIFDPTFSEEKFSNARDNLGARSLKKLQSDRDKERSPFLNILMWTDRIPPERGRHKIDLTLTFPTTIQSREELQRLDWLACLWNDARQARNLQPIDCYRHLYDALWNISS